MPKKLVRSVATAGVSAVAGWVTLVSWGIPSAVGARPRAIRPYAASSPHYRDGAFHNSEPSHALVTADAGSVLMALLRRGRTGRPSQPVPLATPLSPAEAGELAITWFGHSSVLIEADGYRVLADPVWSKRVSPSQLVGPARMHPVPAPVESLPRVDAIVISHDHYDHLDKPTVQVLCESQDAPFVVPIGVGAHLRQWRVPGDRIIELDWDESTTIGGLTLTCTQARHFSGRGLARNTTQWSSWAVAGPQHRVFFGGDSGYTEQFADVGAKHGPFDVSLLPVGAYDVHWPDIHMTPEESIRTHADLNRGDAQRGLVIPIHWATFNLGLHPWAEPIARLCTAAEAAGAAVSVPMPGQRVDALRPPNLTHWWRPLA